MNRIAVGTPVTVDQPYGASHRTSNNLVVMSDENPGYGVGPEGNNPEKRHNEEEGWLYYHADRVHPKANGFLFADIQVGDTIRRTEKWDNTGTIRSTEGVVHLLGSVWATTREGITMGFFRDDLPNSHMTLELLNRPEPEPEPQITDGTKAGDKILAVVTGGIRKMYTKNAAGTWETLVITPSSVHAGFVWSDESLNTESQRVDVTMTRL